MIVEKVNWKFMDERGIEIAILFIWIHGFSFVHYDRQRTFSWRQKCKENMYVSFCLSKFLVAVEGSGLILAMVVLKVLQLGGWLHIWLDPVSYLQQ